MTPHLIIILSLSASTVGFALLADWFRREAWRILMMCREANDDIDEWREIVGSIDQDLLAAEGRINAALACLTPHSANVGKRMARKLRGEE